MQRMVAILAYSNDKVPVWKFDRIPELENCPYFGQLAKVR